MIFKNPMNTVIEAIDENSKVYMNIYTDMLDKLIEYTRKHSDKRDEFVALYNEYFDMIFDYRFRASKTLSRRKIRKLTDAMKLKYSLWLERLEQLIHTK
jgi:hypothetical protein